MKLPLQITFRSMDASQAMETRVRALAERLERFSAHITSCHVVIDSPSHRQHQGGLFRVRIDIVVPGGELSAGAAHPRDHVHEDPYIALRDAFRTARRKLEDYERTRHRRIRAARRTPSTPRLRNSV